ncbi:AAA family ATPase [Subtercola frigoramans]|uniref:MinD-like ATPase involved in chromosome partitioning or flagellar assembly n=1 Tax=Subtercola frigoramans TaxID=120298 RepID=A0ABS2L7F9_9MICO|nr:AAA family ATPase [Subtercola frigoramans]MBM7473009.1 MinD-like ATPase involved in chromosome partitioning or flagellar assembly [Subtercola frigoramans]
MAIDRSRALERPLITARLRPDNTALLRVDNVTQQITENSEGAALQSLVRQIQAEAVRVERPVRVTVTAQTGLSFLVVDIDGAIEEESFMPFEELPKPWPPPEDGSDDAEDPIDEDSVDEGPIDDETDNGEPAGEETHSVSRLDEEGAGNDASDEIGTEDQAAEVADDESPTTGDAVRVNATSTSAAADATGDRVPVSSAPFTARSSYIAAGAVPSERPETAEALDQPETAGRPARKAEPTAAERTSAPARTRSSEEPGSKPLSDQARRDLLEAPSFLAEPSIVEPARQGFAGFVNHLGLRLPPGATERAERSDVEEISRHLSAHRTISVINRKGGANKTPTVVNLAAVFARYGGGGVLAWDNNETMGTLGWRTDSGGHDSTVLDVLASADELLDAKAEFGQMSKFVHHQQADKFDVLRSDEDVAGTHEMTAAEVDVVHSIAAKYYRLIFMDSGNSDRAENWLRMLDHTDQLVVPTTTMEDRAQAALLTLQAVQSRSEKAAELARNAVVIVSEWQPKESSISERMADDFRPFVRDVVIVPFDPALKAGRIQHSALQPATRRAWLAAAAAIARGL